MAVINRNLIDAKGLGRYLSKAGRIAHESLNPSVRGSASSPQSQTLQAAVPPDWRFAVFSAHAQNANYDPLTGGHGTFSVVVAGEEIDLERDDAVSGIAVRVPTFGPLGGSGCLILIMRTGPGTTPECRYATFAGDGAFGATARLSVVPSASANVETAEAKADFTFAVHE